MTGSETIRFNTIEELITPLTNSWSVNMYLPTKSVDKFVDEALEWVTKTDESCHLIKLVIF